MNDNDDLWVEYARLQREADRSQLGDRAWGADEALDRLLDRIEAQKPIAPSEIHNLTSNRARKHRARRLILSRNSILLPSVAANEDARLEALDALRRSVAVWSELETRLLFAIAAGETYGALADQEGAPVSTIKTWVRRARLRGAG